MLPRNVRKEAFLVWELREDPRERHLGRGPKDE